jgi:hypothetical protein
MLTWLQRSAYNVGMTTTQSPLRIDLDAELYVKHGLDAAPGVEVYALACSTQQHERCGRVHVFVRGTDEQVAAVRETLAPLAPRA